MSDCGRFIHSALDGGRDTIARPKSLEPGLKKNKKLAMISLFRLVWGELIIQHRMTLCELGVSSFVDGLFITISYQERSRERDYWMI